MSALIRRKPLPLKGELPLINPTGWTLDDGAGNQAQVWPALGFNLISWKVNTAAGPIELIHRDPGLFEDGKGTRSGNPILFPFPNRIAAGRYQFEGNPYQLELSGDGGKTAIHGFACRHPWRLLEASAENNESWITAEFDLFRDGPGSRAQWPKNGRLQMTYRLIAHGEFGVLRIEAKVDHEGPGNFPFGLGYHPYFSALPGWKTQVEVPAASFWELDQCIPTGKKMPVDASRNLNKPTAFDSLKLDDVLCDLPPNAPKRSSLPNRLQATQTPEGQGTPELLLRGRMIYPGKGELGLWCESHYREVVVYTPPSRDSFCIEPYTCPTNAINNADGGIGAGWLVLQPGETWTSVNEWVFKRV